MIECLIFSKDRACQLSLLLRSISKNFSDLKKIHCLYKATTKDFSKGYDILIKKYPSIDFIEEKNFVQDTKRIVANFTEKHCLCLVDDSAIINDMEVSMTLSILNSSDIHCISLRLNPNLSLTYPTQVENRLPKTERINVAGIILRTFDWSKQKALTDFNYPSCIDGHIYLTGFLKYMVENLKFTSVNNLEECIDANRDKMKPLMAMFEKTVVLTIPNNLTQSTNPSNRSGKSSEMSLEALNRKFLDGFEISTDNIYGVENNACHMEIPFEWRKTNGK